MTQSRRVSEGKSGLAEDRRGGFVCFQRLVAPTKVKEDSASVIEDLAEPLGLSESPVALFSDCVGFECLFIEAHVLIATPATLVNEPGRPQRRAPLPPFGRTR